MGVAGTVDYHVGSVLLFTEDDNRASKDRFHSLDLFVFQFLLGFCALSRVANGTGSTSYTYNFICNGSVPAPSLRSMILFLITYSQRYFYALMLATLNLLSAMDITTL